MWRGWKWGSETEERGQGEGSVVEVLAVQMRGPEFKSPETMPILSRCTDDL